MYIGKKIDYKILSNGVEYYKELGYKEVEVPWIVDFKSYDATDPRLFRQYFTLDGYLVASGEQGFINLMEDENFKGKAFCVTPCFRDEDVLDETHQKYFMKLELIDTNVSLENLNTMKSDALNFFKKFTEAQVVKTEDRGEHTFDIIDKRTGIELGSYGIRKIRNISWIYGTGVALPRLQTVIKNYV
jgi:aspartyl/asparaginyl-tRNA synthetase